DHADHCHGIDDIRQIFHHHRRPVPGYARRETLDHLRRRFGYVFDGRNGYPATVEAHTLPDDMMIGDIRITSVDQPHGDIFSTGFRFESHELSICYSTDFHEVTNEMMNLFAGTDIWVVDALRERPHPTHTHLALTLDAIAAVRPRQAILTHMDQSMDYAHLCATLPSGVVPGHDGMTVRIQ
ncbi:MAG: MBL fold metallo-hydrolase, partial [Alphaproteobacteria bacterium]|nr:MBL fold metallo-hydrolase [Alphaproteobacteria bacterium]